MIGYDHHFGRNREGNYKNLEELSPVYDFKLEEIAEQDVNDVAVSSTKSEMLCLKEIFKLPMHCLVTIFH